MYLSDCLAESVDHGDDEHDWHARIFETNASDTEMIALSDGKVFAADIVQYNTVDHSTDTTRIISNILVCVYVFDINEINGH